MQADVIDARELQSLARQNKPFCSLDPIRIDFNIETVS